MKIKKDIKKLLAGTFCIDCVCIIYSQLRAEGFIENGYIQWQLLGQVANKKSSAKYRPPVPGIITRS